MLSVCVCVCVQVRGSASQTREALQRHFQEVQTAVSRLLTERLNALLQEVDNIELDSVSPLDDCQKLIEHGVSTADELLREGECQINGRQTGHSLLGLQLFFNLSHTNFIIWFHGSKKVCKD